MLTWEDHQNSILDRITKDSTLKICVKLIDESSLIEDWILHHARIVGFSNLIVADNGSSDPKTLAVYEKFRNDVNIFRFQGAHNEIHWHPRFKPLFDALTSTSRYVSFIDADERLVYMGRDTWIADHSICQALDCVNGVGIVPTTWLINTINSYNTFSLLDTEGKPILENNLKWGKPLLPAALVGTQAGIHNVQFTTAPFESSFGTRLFLLHYTQFPERRIAVNRSKLVSRGLITNNTSIEELLSMDFSDEPDKSVARFISEIKTMLVLADTEAGVGSPTCQDFVILEENGSVRYVTDRARDSLNTFLLDGAILISQLLGDRALNETSISDPATLLTKAVQARSEGEAQLAEVLFTQGMANYPTYLDQYQGPAFRKELMRMFLARREWRRAIELIPPSGDPGAPYWYEILFARAYGQAGEIEKAAGFWEKIQQRDPRHQEASAFFTSIRIN